MVLELVAAGLSGTVVNVSVTVAVAAIAAEFGASIAVAAATVVMLNVAMAFTMPLAGAWTARLGPRRLIVAAGVVVFGSSVLLSLAPNLAVLAIARAAQGIGLAAVVPVSVQASGQLLTGERRAHALGWWGASNGLGLAFAPLVGGAIIDLVGWRWVTVPSCLLGLALVLTALLAFPADLQRGSTIRFRGLGLVASVSGTGMSALAAASAGAWAVAAVLALACGVASMTAARALREDGELAELRRWFHDRNVRRSLLGATLQMVANGLVQVAVPAWLIVNGVLGAGGAAAILMGMTLTMAAMGPITGRRGSVSYPSRLRRGLAGCAAGLVGLTIAATTGPWWLASPALVVLGLGAGSLLSPSLTAFSRTTAGESTVALSLFNLARLGSFGLGGLLGGAFVDAGMPGTAFLAVAVLCGLAAARVTSDRAPADHARKEPGNEAREEARNEARERRERRKAREEERTMVDGLRLDTTGHTLKATIDAGEGNLFSREMMDALVEAIQEAGRTEEVRFVRLRAEGDTFCMGRAKGGATPDELRGMARRIATVNETLRTTPLTVIAEVNGSAAGFGVGMIGASDIAVAADGATFAFPEIKAGFAPAVVISWARFMLPPRLLYDMVSTGDAIDAARALEAGLLTEVVPIDALAARVEERIARLEAVDAFALREMKRFLVFTRAMDPGTAAQASVDALVFSGLRVIGKF